MTPKETETVTGTLHSFWWGAIGAFATFVALGFALMLIDGFYWDAYDSGFKCGRYSIGCDGRFQAEEK